MGPGTVDDLEFLDLARSTRGASKQRRDQINKEICSLRDLLPLPESARQRLSQLQIMSLSCVYIRKCNILQKLFGPTYETSESLFDFFQSLTGFLLITTRDGKLVYISENVTDYLGHSMVDMKTQGDSLYDIIDRRDHATVQQQLLHGGTEGKIGQDVAFFTRMNMSRSFKRLAGLGDVKIMHVKGHFVLTGNAEGSSDRAVFMAVCTPLFTPDVKENVIMNNTMVFKSVHSLDMSFLEISQTGEHHLGLSNNDIFGKSWYSLLHPGDIHEAREKHVQLIRSRHEMGCMMTVCLVTESNELLWVNIVMHVRQSLVSSSDEPVIVCINQVISEQEAYQFRFQSQMYSLHTSKTPDYACSQSYPIMDDPDMANQTFVYNAQPATYCVAPESFDAAFEEPFMRPDQMSPHFYSQQMCPKEGTVEPLHAGRAEHDGTLRALKRKLEGNILLQPTCKVAKVERVDIPNCKEHQGKASYDGDTRFGHRLAAVNSPPMDTRISYQTLPNSYEPTQIMTNTIYNSPLFSPEKSKNLNILESLTSFENAVTSNQSPIRSPAQITVPDCFLTPEPSPSNSPNTCYPSPNTNEQVVPNNDIFFPGKENKVFHRQPAYPCMLQKRTQSPPAKRAKTRDLPVIDLGSLESFFDEICDMKQDVPVRTKPKLPVIEASDIDDFFLDGEAKTIGATKSSHGGNLFDQLALVAGEPFLSEFHGNDGTREQTARFAQKDDYESLMGDPVRMALPVTVANAEETRYATQAFPYPDSTRSILENDEIFRLKKFLTSTIGGLSKSQDNQ